MNEITDKQTYWGYSNSNGKIQQEHNRSPQCVKKCNVDKSKFVLCAYNNKTGKSTYTNCGLGIDDETELSKLEIGCFGREEELFIEWAAGHEGPKLLLSQTG